MISVLHPSGTRFTYIPKYSVVKVMGKYSTIPKKRKEGGVLITYRNGRKVFRLNSDYPRIKPLPWNKNVSRGTY